MQQPGSNEVAATLTAIAAATEAVKNITIVGLLLGILWGGIRKWWVFGWVYESKERSEQFYRDIVMRQLSVTQKAVEGMRESGNAAAREAP